MTNWLNQLLPVFSLIGLGSSIFLNVLTFFGMNLSLTIPAVFLLHLLAFVLFVSFIFYSKSQSIDIDKLTKTIPKWIMLCCCILLVYSLVSIALSSAASGIGGPDIWNDRYVLQNKGTLIREITEIEYYSLLNLDFRFFTSLWIICFCLLAAGYWQINQIQNFKKKSDKELY